MNKKLELKSIIENNELALEFQDLTKAQEQQARKEIKKAQEQLQALEAPAESAGANKLNKSDVTMTVRQLKNHKEFRFFYKGVEFGKRNSKRQGQEAYLVCYDTEKDTVGLLVVGKLSSCQNEKRLYDKLYQRERKNMQAHIIMM